MILEDLKAGIDNLPSFLRRVYGLETVSTPETGGDELPTREKEAVSVDSRSG
jgi:hypothetical protein